MLHFPKLAFINSPDPVQAVVTSSNVKPSVVSNIEDRLRYYECLTPQQRTKFRRQLAADITAAVLALSK